MEFPKNGEMRTYYWKFLQKCVLGLLEDQIELFHFRMSLKLECLFSMFLQLSVKEKLIIL